MSNHSKTSCNSSKCIDYFATLGRANGPLKPKYSLPKIPCTDLKDSNSKFSSYNDVWNNAITDIAVVMSDESLPDPETWELVNKSIDGLEIFPPHIAFRRRKHSFRLDHIKEIKLIQEGGVVPPGFELISKSISGENIAYLNPIGYIAIKRAKNKKISYLYGYQLIDDFQIVLYNENEYPPENYLEVDTIFPVMTAGKHDKEEAKSVMLVYNLRSPMGLLDISYDSATIDRYPLVDQKGYELPAKELPMFGFPNGLKLFYGSLQLPPKTSLYSFVFTDVNGDHFYAECLRFYERISTEEFDLLFQEIFQLDLSNLDGDNTKYVLPETVSIYCPKVICIISRKPFYRSMRSLLQQMYAFSSSHLPYEIEYLISAVVDDIPLPFEGGRSFHVLLDNYDTNPEHRFPNESISFHLPDKFFFPILDFDFSSPLRCLSLENLLIVFLLMLQESKLVFLCQSNTMLLETMETLRALLFPLVWASTFVSPLPDSLSGLLGAPGGFMIGFHLDDSILNNIEENVTNVSPTKSNRNINANSFLIERMSFSQSLLNGTYIVDLSLNIISKYDNYKIETLTSSQGNQLLNILPKGPRKRLQMKLQSLAKEFCLGPTYLSSQKSTKPYVIDPSYDHAFVMKENQSVSTLDIRDTFLIFMIDILGNYSDHIIPLEQDINLSSSFRTFQESFNVRDYISSANSSLKNILECIVETQMFSVLLQQRSSSSHPELVFYEKVASLFRELSLTAIGVGDKIPEIPMQLYKLTLGYEILQRSHVNLTSGLGSLTSPIQSLQQPGPKSPPPSSYASLRFSMSSHSTNSLSSSSSNSSLATSSNNSKISVGQEKLGKLLSFIAIFGDNNLYSCHGFDNVQLYQEFIHRRRVTQGQKVKDERNELDWKSSLQLENPMKGPLLFTIPSIDSSLISNSCESDSHSWGILRKEVLDKAKTINPNLIALKNFRHHSINRVDKNIIKIIRPSYDRLSFGYHEFLPRPVNNSKTAKETKAAVIGWIDVSSSTILLLTSRILYHCHDHERGYSIRLLLQLCGIFAQIETFGFLHYVEECIWRALLISCVAIGGNFCKCLAFIFYDSLIEYYPSPDALSFGEYHLACTNDLKTSPVRNLSKMHIDQYLYLEEIGLAWIKDRKDAIAKAKKEQEEEKKRIASTNSNVSSSSTVTSSTSVGSSSSGSRFSLTGERSIFRSVRLSTSPIHASQSANNVNKESNTNVKAPTTVTIRINTIESSVTVSKLFHLVRSSGIFSYSKLHGLIFSSIAKTTEDLSILTNSESKVETISHFLTHRLLRIEDELVKSSLTTTNSGSKDNMLTPNMTPIKSSTSVGKLDSDLKTPTHDNEFSNNSAMKIDPIVVRNLANDSSFSDNETSDDDIKVAKANEVSEGDTVDNIEKLSIDDKSNTTSKDNHTTSESISSNLKTQDNETNIASDESNNLSVYSVQTQLNDLMHEKFKQDRKVVGISSQTKCSCGFSMLDEEILSAWSGYDRSTEENKIMMNKEKDILHDLHLISCPSCRKQISPKLLIKCFTAEIIDMKTKSRGKTKEMPQLELLWSTDVDYISPYALRYAIEDLLRSVGFEMLNAKLLQRYHPIVFWNLTWYNSRLNLPCALLPISKSLDHIENERDIFASFRFDEVNPSDFEGWFGPVIVGWRETVVRARIAALFFNPMQIGIGLSDLFVGISTDHCKEIAKLAENMHSSPSAMRLSILTMRTILQERQELDNNEFGQSISRQLYVMMLTIAYMFKTSVSATVNSKEVFDTYYSDAIKCVLSPSDFEKLEVSQEELEAFLPSETTKAFRFGFGFLF